MTDRKNPHTQKIWQKTWASAFVVLVWAAVGAVPVFAQNALLRLHELQLADSGEQKVVSLRFSQPPTSIKSFALASPPRIVVDVKGATERLPSATYPAADPLVKQIRVGFHTEYVRFVIDLKTSTVPPFAAKQDKNLVTVALGRQTKAVQNTKSHLIFSRDKKAVAPQTRPPSPQQTVQDLPEKSVSNPKPPKPAASTQAASQPSQPPVRDEGTATQSKSTTSMPKSTTSMPKSTTSTRSTSTARSRLLLPGVSLLNPSASSRSARPRYSLLGPTKKSVPQPTVPARPVRPVRPAQPPASKPDKVPEKALQTEAPQTVAATAKPRTLSPPLVRPSPTAKIDKIDKIEQKKTNPNALPRQARRHLGKGQLLYDQGKVDEAIAEWRETARLTPNNPKVHHLLGLALQDRGDLTEAITELKTALRLDPDNATAHVHLAQALEAQGDVQAAQTAYKKAAKIVPTSAHVHNRLGHLLATQGDWQAAAKEWQKTTELQPDYAYAYANLGEALERIEKKKEALAAYREAVSLDPQAPFADEVRQRITKLSAYGF